MNNGELMNTPILTPKTPSGHSLVGIGEEEMEVENQQTGPSAKTI
jgi:hypothetical protein